MEQLEELLQATQGQHPTVPKDIKASLVKPAYESDRRDRTIRLLQRENSDLKLRSSHCILPRACDLHTLKAGE